MYDVSTITILWFAGAWRWRASGSDCAPPYPSRRIRMVANEPDALDAKERDDKFLGIGEVAPTTREVLRCAERDRSRRSHVHVG